MSLSRSLIFLVVCCVALAVADKQDMRIHSAELNLMSFMSRSNDALQNNPQRSVTCFEYYIPLINEIAQTYENDFKACVTASEEAQSAAAAATADQRDELAQSVNASCSALSQCTEAASAQDIFQCYVNEGSGSAKTLYGVSNNATVQLDALNESIRRIESDETVCTTATKIEYEQNSSQAYADFNNCILGVSEVPTTTPEPETTTTDSTTEQPTTAEDSTAAVTADITIPEEDLKPEEDLFKFVRGFNRFRV